MSYQLWPCLCTSLWCSLLADRSSDCSGWTTELYYNATGSRATRQRKNSKERELAGVEAVGLVTSGNTLSQIVLQGLFHLELWTPPPAAALLSSSAFTSSARKKTVPVVHQPFCHFLDFFFNHNTCPWASAGIAQQQRYPPLRSMTTGRADGCCQSPCQQHFAHCSMSKKKGKKAAGQLAPPQSHHCGNGTDKSLVPTRFLVGRGQSRLERRSP